MIRTLTVKELKKLPYLNVYIHSRVKQEKKIRVPCENLFESRVRTFFWSVDSL